VAIVSDNELEAEELLAKVQEALNNSTLRGLRHLKVEQRDGSLLICGAVTSFYHKQMAQEIVLALAGTITVLNQVEVTEWQPPSDD
jgi:osmotically-inducible protein OsmY